MATHTTTEATAPCYSDRHPDGRYITFYEAEAGYLVAEQLHSGDLRFGTVTGWEGSTIAYQGDDGRDYRLPRRHMFALGRPV